MRKFTLHLNWNLVNNHKGCLKAVFDMETNLNITWFRTDELKIKFVFLAIKHNRCFFCFCCRHNSSAASTHINDVACMAASASSATVCFYWSSEISKNIVFLEISDFLWIRHFSFLNTLRKSSEIVT